MQEALSDGVIQRNVPGDHMLHRIDQFVDLFGIRLTFTGYDARRHPLAAFERISIGDA